MNAYKQQAVAELPGPMRMSRFQWPHPPEPPKFTFRCPACGNRLRAELGAAGRLGRCPACEVLFNVPSPS